LFIARLQLKDFKSFGGSHDLRLEQCMTAIVGPNGSGKSNLLDALRWVLGDSHATKLRIANQGGLIFHGSSSRSAATEAEVSVQLREGTRLCAIRRRVSDSGAVVTVDGSRVTLSELDEVKRRWQLAGDRFAFIGQGDVADVIQQRPTGRRILLESLFGIDEYRKKRGDASERLREAGEEYNRLRIHLAELSARRSEIAPEVERASAAREMLDLLEGDRRLLYWARRAACERAIAVASGERDALVEALRRRELWRGLWERDLAFLEGNIAELSQTRQAQVRELEIAKTSLSNSSRTAYGYGAALTSVRRRLSQITDERAGLEGKLQSLRAENERLNKDSKKGSRELEELRKKLAEAEENYRRQEESTRLARETRERINRERGEIDGEMSTLKGRMKSLGLALRGANGRAGDSPDLADDSLKEIEREMDDLERRYSELLDTRAEEASRYRDVYASLQKATADLQRAKKESFKISGRLSELQDQAQTEIYPSQVQHILSAAKLGRIDARPRAVIDAFTCPVEFAAAVEAFLGGRQFWLLLDTIEEVGVCIEALKKRALGRATFLPLERSRPRQRDISSRLPREGIVGWAIELVETENHWRACIEHIMGDLLIVDDYKTGQTIVRGGFRGPIATLDGEVFQPGGAISGGRAQKQGRAIEIKSAISKIEAEAEASRRLVDSLTLESSRLEEEETSASGRKESISAEIRALSSKRSELDSQKEDIIKRRARLENERESITVSLKEGARVYASLARRKRELCSAAPENVRDVDINLIKEIERLKSGVAVAEEKGRSSFVILERVMSETRQTEKAMVDLDTEMSVCEQDARNNVSNLRRLAARYAEIAARRRALVQEMAGFAERYESISGRRDRRRERLERAKSAGQTASSDLTACDMRIADCVRERGELIQTWEEQYPYADREEPLEVNLDELRRSIRERERNFKALGEVDMGVLSEDRNLGGRMDFLGDNLDDVSKSMKELDRIISDADRQARMIFTEALEEIDKKFNALFQRLFVGGDARLEMIEGESLWDSGVDVIARPPGKYPTGIGQLSGGEQSLSAIALLFASLEVAQSPIAVLDEVDAALDEANLRRFADLAKEASKERQILVMTHRRATMERADILYGVTLTEPGLSKVIGVRVEDWA
jgi:chromosome segregation protein